MSHMIGTSVAQGVAQTAMQAQEVARRRDRREAHNDRAAQRVRERFEAQLLALEEGQETDVTRLHIDAQLPQHSTADDTLAVQARIRNAGQPPVEPTAPPPDQPSEDDAPAPTPDQPLYRHLDITA